jgi:Spy/CpxP family protein refolding chaperone
MKRPFYLVLLIAISVTAVSAQEAKPSDQTPDTQRPAGQDNRGNLLQQLALAPDQVQQIRRLNQQRKPMMDDAQRRAREANQALDAAIYADQVNEDDVKAKLHDLQIAQAEVARLRFTNELAIRRILTSDQLVRFRDLRREFAEAARENSVKRREGNGIRPNGLQGNPDKQNMRRLLRQNRKMNNAQPVPPAAKPNP